MVMTETATTATLQVAERTATLGIIPAAVGEPGVNVGALLKDTGHVTYDAGFVNTAACKSAITYIDGDVGVLRYRGYPIEQLAEKSTYVETAYLLIYGDLPTPSQLADFDSRIRHHTMLHEDLRNFFSGFPRDAHPMPVLSSAVSALSTFYQDSLDPFDPQQVEISTIRLLAKLPTIAAYAYKKSIGQPFLYPDNTLSLPENFLRMTFGTPAEPYEVDPVHAKALDLLLLLHADHEQNCSTSTVRLVGSSHANLFASVSAGINALFGPLHGGANQAVLEMLGRLQSFRGVTSGVHAPGEEQGGRRPPDGLRPPGLQELRPPRLAHQGGRRRRPGQARRRRPAARPRPRPLRPSPSPTTTSSSAGSTRTSTSTPGSSTRRWAFPTKMFTVLFALGRLPGWIAQWREMMGDPETKIGRPRQIYVGAATRDYVGIDYR
jgi:citrate synthase